MKKRKTLYKSIQLLGEGDSPAVHHLDYYVLEKEVEVDGFSINTYGIEISKRTCDGTEPVEVEYRRVYDIFCTYRETEEALEKLVRNAVTPVALLDVLHDMVGIGTLVNEEVSFRPEEQSTQAVG